MSHRFVISMVAAFFAVFALGIAAVIGVSRMSEAPVVSARPAPVAPTISTPSFPATEAAVEVPKPIFHVAPLEPVTDAQNHSPGTPMTVSVSEINQLADAVKLGASNTGDVGKEVWARETPKAERLLGGMCDCDQRNWLNHFVETGKAAIKGSDNYYQSVQLLATLRRSNADLQTAKK